MKRFLLIFCMLWLPSLVMFSMPFDDGKDATTADKKQNNVSIFNNLINEAIKVHTSNNFSLFREQRILMKDKVTNVINMQLEAGQWYHFVFIGDPSCKKMRITLFKEGIGDFVSDRTGEKNQEFYSEFSFIAPVSGIYEFSCFQKGEMEKPLAYLMLFRKNGTAPAKTN